MMRLQKILAIISIIVVIVFYGYRHQTEKHAVVVAVRAATESAVAPTVSVMGDVVAAQGIDVSAKVSGMVKAIYFQSGQVVKKGDLLAELANDDMKALLDQRIAKLNLSKQEYDRYVLLMKKGNVSRSDYDKAVSQLAFDQADVRYQTALFNQTRIEAPFDGKLGINNIHVGQYISPGQVFVNLQAVAPLYVDFNVPAQYANQITVGAELHFINDAAPGVDFTGKVIALGASLLPETRTRPVRAVITSSINSLTPGMYVQVNVALTQPSNAILIPQSAIVYSPMGEYVYKVIQHQVEKVKIRLGESVGDNVVITQGLDAGDTVVCAGQIKLHPGVTVNAVAY